MNTLARRWERSEGGEASWGEGIQWENGAKLGDEAIDFNRLHPNPQCHELNDFSFRPEAVEG